MARTESASSGRIEQTKDDLKKHLMEQLTFLKEDTAQYDAGKIEYARRMAVTLRQLAHDTKKWSRSLSLFDQLGIKEGYFYDTATAAFLSDLPPDFDHKNKRFCGGFLGIIGMTHTARLVPYLDSQENRKFFGFVPFEEFWNRTILLDSNEHPFTRKDIVHAIADTDGGAHVDPALEAKYHALTRQGNLGIAGQEAGVWHSTNDIALACVRQITHEVLRTLVLDYPRQKQIAPKGHPVFAMRAVCARDEPTNEAPQRVNYERIKPGRNTLCPCRSGEKYKRCHGKYFDVY